MNRAQFQQACHVLAMAQAPSSPGNRVAPATAKSDPELKGKPGGNCNREACQQPVATWYNRGTDAYYCPACAQWINEVNTDIVPPLCQEGIAMLEAALAMLLHAEPPSEHWTASQRDRREHYRHEGIRRIQHTLVQLKGETPCLANTGPMTAAPGEK